MIHDDDDNSCNTFTNEIPPNNVLMDVSQKHFGSSNKDNINIVIILVFCFPRQRRLSLELLVCFNYVILISESYAHFTRIVIMKSRRHVLVDVAFNRLCYEVWFLV